MVAKSVAAHSADRTGTEHIAAERNHSKSHTLVETSPRSRRRVLRLWPALIRARYLGHRGHYGRLYRDLKTPALKLDAFSTKEEILFSERSLGPNR